MPCRHYAVHLIAGLNCCFYVARPERPHRLSFTQSDKDCERCGNIVLTSVKASCTIPA